MNPGDGPHYRVREIWPEGTVIKGDYTIQSKLGSGGFGTVYLAKHQFLGTTHVIKRLHEQLASDGEYVRKFVNEARSVRRLRACPNVVEVEHMTQSEDGHLILVMEFIGGGDLAGLMAARALTIDEVIDFARQIAVGLAAAHAAGLIHRDIKPQNVMLSQDSRGKTLLKLIDFGIAADHLSHQQTSVMRAGSIGFAAPEQWVKAGKELDGRTDLYALGATIYKMLCGKMPYETATDIGDWIEQVKKGPPVGPGKLRRDVPQGLSDLVMEMLAVRPEGRPADAEAVIARLEGIAAGRRAAVAPVAQTVKQEGSGERREAAASPVSQWPKWLVGAGLAGVLLVAGAWYKLSGDQPVVKAKVDPPVALDTKPEPVAPRVVSVPEPPKKEAPKKEEPKKEARQQARAELTPELRPAAAKPEPPPVVIVDHAALGDTALNAADYRTALTHYKALGDAKRIATVQRAVEADLDERIAPMLDKGQYAEAMRIADGWMREFPGSQRLQNLRAKIVRARDSQ